MELANWLRSCKIYTCNVLHTHERSANLELIIFAVGCPIPFVAVVVSNTWIYMYIKKHFKIQKQHFINLRPTFSFGPGSSSPLSSYREYVVREPEIAVTNLQIKEITQQLIQITKNLFVVVCTFFICLFPIGFILLVSKPASLVSKWYFIEGFANRAINFLYMLASIHISR